MMKSHCTEGTLLAILDGLPVDAGGKEHVAECPECGAALADLAGHASAFGELATSFRVAAPTPPAFDPAFTASMTERRQGRRRTGIAVVAAGIALVLLVPPVRGWVVTAVAEFWPFETSPGAEVHGGGPGPSAATVSIQQEGTFLRLFVSEDFSSVSVVPSREPGATVRIAVTPPSPITALPDGFRVETTKTTSVTLAVSPSITSLEVMSDDGPIWNGAIPHPLRAAWTVPLR
ncbi:MAG: hypothetical protein OEZ65_14480 [Gemmatimonadota bacterium]|nr:hypothetical protein [Gemmatimonadota bacterium]